MKTGKGKTDFIIIGGGLSGCLTLHCLRRFFPDKSILLFEKGPRLCSPHTWSFHDTDIPESEKTWVLPLISHSWDKYVVHFPQYSRQLPNSYHSIRSEDLQQKTLALQDSLTQIECDQEAHIHSPTSIFYKGTQLDAGLIIDARGWAPLSGPVGFQKFLGLEIELESPHDLQTPILKDARLPQTDGYRFMYVLPWDHHHLLIEDTYYSNQADLDTQKINDEILLYAKRQGWKVKKVLSQEQGSLPLILSAQTPTLCTATVGARSTFYQPVTGYTFPQTLQTLAWLREQLIPGFSASVITQEQNKRLQRFSLKQHTYLLLNRMLFISARPQERYKVLQRFYRLSGDLIHRFYSGQNRISDFFQIFMGRPPVPMHRVPSALFPKSSRKNQRS